MEEGGRFLVNKVWREQRFSSAGSAELVNRPPCGHWPLAGEERDQEDMKGERSSISGTAVTSAKCLAKG